MRLGSPADSGISPTKKIIGNPYNAHRLWLRITRQFILAPIFIPRNLVLKNGKEIFGVDDTICNIQDRNISAIEGRRYWNSLSI
jgi:hypothetical protein